MIACCEQAVRQLLRRKCKLLLQQQQQQHERIMFPKAKRKRRQQDDERKRRRMSEETKQQRILLDSNEVCTAVMSRLEEQVSEDLSDTQMERIFDNANKALLEELKKQSQAQFTLQHPCVLSPIEKKTTTTGMMESEAPIRGDQ
mmetsp:Transcript_8179/g.18974  ORF Transcript_8179/g.18974 Transcript_8179/m.18974 type:complete len:144 (+) Transcript_8179:3-434(+)